MKKRNLKNLKLNKITISNFKLKGGAEQSARRTNCDLCNSNPHFTNGCPKGPKVSVNEYTCTTIGTLFSRLIC
ncbi:hypothetical protein [uncultured Kordia sp.]|uniref:hypothetical protein n=1 Tax=uncultured Kordia sp. TaxID=507699 RepID=UPI00262118E2|nr:hypothetical protein [uncultured Kordia sp.]